jgi:hypothetical protein
MKASPALLPASIVLLSFALTSIPVSGAAGSASVGANPADLAAQDATLAAEQSDIHSADVKKRMHAFVVITRPLRDHNGFGTIQAERASVPTKRAVTALLADQVGFPVTLPNGLSSGHPIRFGFDPKAQDGELLSEFVPELIEAVGELHDPDAIPLLYYPAVLTSGSIATRALAYFGHSEARRVEDLYKSQSPGLVRNSLRMVLIDMLEMHTIDDPALLARAEYIFVNESYSHNEADRMLAATALSYIHHAQSADRLHQMAASDSARLITNSDHQIHYPVRERALLALRGELYLGNGARALPTPSP